MITCFRPLVGLSYGDVKLQPKEGQRKTRGTPCASKSLAHSSTSGFPWKRSKLESGQLFAFGVRTLECEVEESTQGLGFGGLLVAA